MFGGRGDWPGLRLSLRRCCLLTKQAARVLNSTAAAKKQMVATTPATTGLARPSSGSSAGGKGSDGVGEGRGGRRGSSLIESWVRGGQDFFLMIVGNYLLEETDQCWTLPPRYCSRWSGHPWRPSLETHTRTPAHRNATCSLTQLPHCFTK